MDILAHRGNVCGPDALAENTAGAVRAALANGWGLELDVRRGPRGVFYFSHDPRQTDDPSPADDVCGAIRRHPSATVALNVKELGYERELLEYLDRQRVLRQMVLFDMELIEPVPGLTAQLFHGHHPAVRIAARVSDRGEGVERALSIAAASVIWLDEFDLLWATDADVRRLRDAGRTVYAVAPDLHGAPFERTRERCLEFAAWGVSAICTDYPASLQRVLTPDRVEAAA